MSQLLNPPDLQGQPPQSDIHPHPSQSQPPSSLPAAALAPPLRPDPNLDPKLSGAGDPPPALPPGAALQLGGLDSNQLLTLLRHLPGVFNKLAEQGGLKESAAEQLQQHLAGRALPGPSSNFTFTTTPGPELPTATVIPQNGKGTKRKRGGKAPGSGDDVEGDDCEDWTRQRKDNHKEVERRRRGNINEGINELARIVPNGSGEKAKGAILNRAVQYIHHLKENEARNIEKWTLEKLLMDQAMGDLQAQLEDVRRLWEDERQAKDRALLELDVIRSGNSHAHARPHAHPPPPPHHAPNPYDPRDRAYHPSDRHHHIQHGHGRPDANPPPASPGSEHDNKEEDEQEQEREGDGDVDMVERHLAMPRDPDVAVVRDPDVAGAEVDAEGEGEGEGGEEDDDADDADGEGGRGKRRRVE